MNQKSNKELSAGTIDDSSTNAGKQHVSPATGNTNVVRISHDEYLTAIDIILKYREQCNNDLDESRVIANELYFKDDNISDVGLSVRCLNVLYGNARTLGIQDFRNMKVKELANISESELMSCWGAGQKCMGELKPLCQRLNIVMKS